MNEATDAEHARHEQLVSALVEPAGGEVYIAEILSRWLSDREIGYLISWITRSRNEHTVRYQDLLARVVAALSDAKRDEESGNYIVIIGPTLARHLLDHISPQDADT